MRSPILFLVFNRPITTDKVFSRIRLAKPPKLYIACDGPRENNTQDAIKVDEVRFICSKVDWHCEVKTLYRDYNLGCGLGVSSAINWFFKYEEEGIILEDDCLPSQSFFKFCDEMLELHRHNKNISLIAGYNKLQKWNDKKLDYFYSFLGGIWGWATWKRAWIHYDFEMSSLDKFVSNNGFVNQMGFDLGMRRQKQLIEAKHAIKNKSLDTWDYQWAFSRHAQNGLSCIPSQSLIRNIGFNDDATHTKQRIDIVVENNLNFPLRDNINISPDLEFDALLLPSHSLMKKFILFLKSFMKLAFYRFLNNRNQNFYK